MQWLSGWLKDLILIILLASFVDLMLPSNSMQRYVKTVFSLFLLMTLLSPVFSLFQKNWSAARLVAAATAEIDNPGAVAASGKAPGQIPSLQEIMQKSGELQAANNKEAKVLLEAQLADALQDDIVSQTGHKADSIKVATEIDDKGTPHIASVQVILSHTNEAPARDGAQPSQGGAIGEIKPVVIEIGTNAADGSVDSDAARQEQSRPASGRAMPAGASAGSDDGALAQVRQIVMQQWQLKAEQVTVTFGK